MKPLLLAAISLLLSLDLSSAGWLDRLGLGDSRATNQPSAASSRSIALSQDQITQSLKEALGKGVQNAVNQLGHDGGFLTNANVRIPMPEQLQAVEKTLRTLHQDTLADQFIGTMNHAAEEAVPQAASVFSQTVKGMTIADAQGILTGPNDAATQYFRRTTQTNLYEKFLPIVKAATDKAGVTSSYKRLISAASGNQLLGSFGSSFRKPEAVDLDSYVTHQALNGLFKMIAEEETRIRASPLARTSDLLQKVFGAVTTTAKP